MTGDRIAILLPDMRGGGVERIRTVLAQQFMARGHAVDFVLSRAQGELLSSIPPGARTIDLKAGRMAGAIWPLTRYLRRERPAALLAALWPMTTIAIAANIVSGRPTRVVVSDHNTLSKAFAGKGPLHRLMLRATLAASYPLAAARVVVSAGVGADLAALSGMSPESFTVIHNPLSSGDVHRSGTEYPWPRVTGRRVLSVGRLKRQKNHAVLLEAVAILNRERAAQLVILGEGEERQALSAQAEALGIADRVSMPGFVANPESAYGSADLFALTSDYEGFGNVLVEALAHGLPIVSTDCPSGPRDILASGAFGALVPCNDAQALARAMAQQLDAPLAPDGQRARARQFTPEKAAEAYLALLFPKVKRKTT